MAKSRIFTLNGSVTLPTNFNLDSQTMRVSESQNTENITAYQGTVYAIFFGSGTVNQKIDITGYPFKGTTASNPGLGSMNGTAGALGSSATFTLDTGVSSASTYVGSNVDIDHSRLVAGAKTSLGFMPASDVTIAWASS